MPDRHTELEFKFDAKWVDIVHFVETIQAFRPSSYRNRSHFDDDYYVRTADGLVLRHRLLGGAGELTYKRRRSDEDLTDRLEINLKFDHSTEVGDVQGFLLQTGHEKLMTIRKSFAHVFHFDRPDYRVEVSLYAAGVVDGWVKEERKFMEIEVVGPTLPLEARQVILEDWRALIRAHVPGIGAQLNESLYEIYSTQVKHNTNYHI